MREIKFRAWDKDNKEMFEPAIQLNDSVYKMIIVDVQEDKTHFAKIENAEIMQYTGLKDKNGKEIYEGDILGQHGFWDILVEFENGCFKAKSADKVRYNNECVNVPLYDSYGLKNFELIGNIHENPELLKGGIK